MKAKRARPLKRPPAFTAAQLRIIDDRIDRRIEARPAPRIKVMIAGQGARRGGCG